MGNTIVNVANNRSSYVDVANMKRDDSQNKGLVEDPLLTAREAAKLLRVSPDWVRRHAPGKIALSPRKLVWRRSTIESFVSSRAPGP